VLVPVQILEALLNESSERRAALEARQTARAAQLLARQEQMAAAAQARREERLQWMGQGHLSPVPKPVTRKEELDQLRRSVSTASCKLQLGGSRQVCQLLCVCDRCEGGLTLLEAETQRIAHATILCAGLKMQRVS